MVCEILFEREGATYCCHTCTIRISLREYNFCCGAVCFVAFDVGNKIIRCTESCQCLGAWRNLYMVALVLLWTCCAWRREYLQSNRCFELASFAIFCDDICIGPLCKFEGRWNETLKGYRAAVIHDYARRVKVAGAPIVEIADDVVRTFLCSMSGDIRQKPAEHRPL